MKILFCIQMLMEMDNPWIYTNYLTNYFKKYILALQQADPEIRIGILMGEAPNMVYTDMPGVEPFFVSRKEMLDSFTLDSREVSRQYFKYCHERNRKPEFMKYHEELVKKHVTFEPDIVISRDNAPYLEEAFPSALVLYTEVGFISRKPFIQTMYFDAIGMNCGSYLNSCWEEIDSKLEWNVHNAELISCVKQTVKKCIMEKNPYIELLDQWKGQFEKLFLLPLQFSGFSNIDAEIDFESQFDVILNVMDIVPQNIGVIVSTHPDYNVLNEKTLRFLNKRYPNFLYHESLLQYNSSSQFLLGLVDGVINLASTIGLQTIFWDIPNISIGKYFAKYISRPFGGAVSYEPLSTEERVRNDKVLFWLLTHYIVMPQKLYDGKWLLQYLSGLLKNYRVKPKSELYDYLDEPNHVVEVFLNSLDSDIPEERVEEKSKVYYDFLVEMSKQYFSGKSIKENKILCGKDILIYGKGAIGYIIALELQEHVRFKGYIDRNTLGEYPFTGNEVVIVTPIQEFKSIAEEIAKKTTARCVSAKMLLHNTME